MRLKFVLSLLSVAVLVFACFLPWITIESKNITISGMNTTGTLYGKPGYFHFLWAGAYLFFLLINKIWSKRAAVGMAAFNIAWALRNFLLLPACQMGECPERREGLYLLLLASFLMFLTPLLNERAPNNIKAN